MPRYRSRTRNRDNLEQIAAILAYLDADIGYWDWIRIGMAIHHETDGAEEGFTVWDDWSSSGYKYPGEGKLRRQWGYFDRHQGSAVTMGTIIYIAREHGVDVDRCGGGDA
jgi:hypothetical protein